MPLIKGKSQKSFVKNLKTEMEHGHPQKQSLAIAYAMKRKAQRKKMADGGDPADQTGAESFQEGFRKATHYAEGGKTRKVNPGMEDQGSDYKNAQTRNAPDYSGGQRKGPKGYPKYQEQAQYEKGVHTPVSGVTGFPGAKGESEAGNLAKETYGGKPHRELRDYGVRKHREKLAEMVSFPKPKLQGLAEGGFIADNYQSTCNEHCVQPCEVHEQASGYQEMPIEHELHNESAHMEDEKGFNQHPVDMHAETSMSEEDLVDRIMEKRSKTFEDEARFSEGGKVANQEHGKNNNELAGFDDNEFDDLVLRDDLSSSYGEDDNAGDALGNKQEDADRADLVDRIMLRRRKQSIPRGYPGR